VFKSITALLSGYAVMFILTMTLFTVLNVVAPESFRDSSVFPEDKYVAVILVAGFLTAVAGGLTTCLIVKEAPLKHSVALAVVSLVLGIMTTLLSPVPQPLWYTVALNGLSFAGIMGVGFLMNWRIRARASRP
jgi:hypothetical protein